MAKADEKKSDIDPEIKVVKVDVEKPKVEEKPSLDGLVKMHRDGNFIHAHPSTLKDHEKNGWKIA